MTSPKLNVIIIHKNISSLEMKKNMWGWIVEVNIKSPQQSKIKYSCKKDYKMTELHVNLREAANYFIQLFYATGQKYSCSRTKLGKLLSIVAFSYALKDIELFDETIYRYDGCGTAINELKSYMDRDIYIQLKYGDDEKFISQIFDEQKIPIQNYEQTESLSDDVKKQIELIFRHFGAYTAYDLGQCINCIVNYPNVTKNDEVDISILQTLSREKFRDIKDHTALIDFMYGKLENDNVE